MSCPENSCSSCLSISIPSCTDDILFYVGITPNTPLKAIITNHFSQKYKQDVTSDVDGNVTLDTTKFPSNFFNAYSGIFILEITDASGNPMTIVNGYTEYPCIAFDVYKFNDAN